MKPPSGAREGSRKGPRLLGHPLHAMLVHFPLGLLPLVFPLELAGWIWGGKACWGLAFFANAAGLAAAVPAAVTGAMDLAGLAGGSKAAAEANRHMLAMIGAAALFGADLSIRGDPGPVPMPWAIVTLGLSLSATFVLIGGAWLGGELVFRHGAGAIPKEEKEA